MKCRSPRCCRPKSWLPCLPRLLRASRWGVAPALLLGALTAAAAVPTGFVDELVAAGLKSPTDVTVSEDGRIFVAEKRGRVFVIENGVRLPTPFVDLTDEVQNVGDRGLLSVTLHPEFAQNQYVYLLYVVDPVFGEPDDSADTVTFSRLTRYTAAGNVADPASRTVLLGEVIEEGIPSCYQTHAAGTVAFGPDGALFISAGDGAHPDRVDNGSNVEPFDADCEAIFGVEQDTGSLRSQSDFSLAGKLLRVDPNTMGGLPDNPHFDGDPNSVPSRIYARGFRQPFRFTIQPGSSGAGTVYVADVGKSTWEELNVVDAGGENLGWPCHEGAFANTTYQADPVIGAFCQGIDPNDLTPPLVSWHHTLPGSQGFIGNAATAVVFYEGSGFPTQYHDALFFGDYGADWIKLVVLDGSGGIVSIQDFANGVESPVDLEYEPATEGLLYVSIVSGEVRRIRWDLQNAPPVVAAAAVPSAGRAPLAVQLSSDGSFDPDGDAIALEWDFGDGTPPTAVANPLHVYQTPQPFTATLTIADAAGNQASSSTTVAADNDPPAVAITFPPEAYAFMPEESVQLQASASDTEDGTVLTWVWELSLVHNNHVHPETFVSSDPSPSGVLLAGHGGAGDRYSYMVEVTVTDSAGASASDRVRLIPLDAPPNAAPAPEISASPGAGEVPLVVWMDASSSFDADSDLLTYHWDFGDGTTSDQEVVSHIYSEPGIHETTLTVTDAMGSSATTSQPILAHWPGLVALYDFASSGNGALVPDLASPQPSLDLTIETPASVTWLPQGGLQIDGPSVIRSSQPAQKLHDTVQDTEELSVAAWIEVPSLSQSGPARLVAMSEYVTPYGANFILGQNADAWAGRLRTSDTSDYGTPGLTSPAGSASLGLHQLVFTRDATGAASIYADGALVGTTSIAGSLGSWSDAYRLSLGNDVDGTRPWLGTLHRVALYAASLEGEQIAQDYAAGLEPGLAKPLLLASPQDQTIVTGGQAALTVVAAGPPPLSHQWQEWNGAVWQDLPGEVGATLTTAPLTVFDDGRRFRCAVGNAAGTVHSVAAQVLVVPEPIGSIQLTARPDTATVTAGGDADFELWLHNPGGVDLISPVLDTDRCTNVSAPTESGTANGVLEPGESWLFTCTVSGAASQSVHLATVSAQTTLGEVFSAESLFSVRISDAPPRTAEGLLALYRIREGGGGIVTNDAGLDDALDLSIEDTSSVQWTADGGLRFEAPTAARSATPPTALANRLLATGALTLEAWVRPSELPSSHARILALSDDPFPTGGNFALLQAASTYQVRLRTDQTDQYGTPELESPIATAGDDRLTHVTFTRDSEGTEVLYADGVAVQSSTRPGDLSTWSGSALLSLGNEPTLDRPWLGTLYLAAVYDRALSAAEVTQNHRAGLTLDASTPVPALPPWTAVTLAAALLALGLRFAARANGPSRRR